MAILDIFSKRLKKLNPESIDTYTYDTFSRKLRVQIIHIMNEALGDDLQYKDRYNKVSHAYTYIVESLSREYGVFNLFGDDPNFNFQRHHYRELINFILSEKETVKAIDAIEMSFNVIDKATRNLNIYLKGIMKRELIQL